jgi:type IV secretory pathway TraG/TraD family ATPase VirD4
LIDPGAHEQAAGIVATVANAVNPFRYLPPTPANEWSARQWAETRAGWVFLTCEEAARAAVLPLLSLWLDSMVRRLLSTELERGALERVWIVADELPVLRRQQKIESLLARGRKRGLCVVIGFQAMPQLRAIYGHDEAATLLSCPTTKAILRTDEPETAEWCSRQIGTREVVHEQIGTSTGPRELRDGFTMQPRRGMTTRWSSPLAPPRELDWRPCRPCVRPSGADSRPRPSRSRAASSLPAPPSHSGLPLSR